MGKVDILEDQHKQGDSLNVNVDGVMSQTIEKRQHEHQRNISSENSGIEKKEEGHCRETGHTKL